MSLPLDVHCTKINDNTVGVPVITFKIDLKTTQAGTCCEHWLSVSIGFDDELSVPRQQFLLKGIKVRTKNRGIIKVKDQKSSRA